MRPLLLLPLAFVFFSCKGSENATDVELIPAEFQGDWKFDEVSARRAIQEMSLSDEEKLKLESSYIGMIRGERRHVDSAGRVTGDSYPEAVVISFSLVRKTENGVIMKTTNSMNKEASQFTRDSITDGVWRSSLLDDALEPVVGVPDDFWMRP